MIITGLVLLLSSFTLLLTGALRASVRPLIGSAALAAAGLLFVVAGGMLVKRGRKLAAKARAAQAGAAPAAIIPAFAPGVLPAGFPAGAAVEAPAYVIYLPAGAAASEATPAP